MQQKIRFSLLILKFIQVNYGVRHVENQELFCRQIGKQFLLLFNQIHFKHIDCLNFMNYISKKSNEQENAGKFINLKFDLSLQSIKQVTQTVNQYCRQNLDAFAFISLYLTQSINNLISSNTPVSEIQKRCDKLLAEMQKLYPAVKVQKQQDQIQLIDPFVQKLHQIQTEQVYETYSLNQGSDEENIKKLRQFVIKKAKQAQKDYRQFVQLAKQVCLQRGYSFKSNKKIKSQKDISSINRTIEKLFDDQKQSQKFKSIQQKCSNIEYHHIQKQINSQTTAVHDDKLQHIVSWQKNKVESQLNNHVNNLNQIQFTIKDLIRAKCFFQQIGDIYKTIQSLCSELKKKQYKILKFKNKLKGNTKDFTFFIKLKHSIAQLKLALKYDSHENEFNHKIYQLKRSIMYTPISNIYIHNQIWSERFFLEQFDIFFHLCCLEENQEKQNLQQKINEINSDDVRKFRNNILFKYIVKNNKLQTSPQLEDDWDKEEFQNILKKIDYFINQEKFHSQKFKLQEQNHKNNSQRNLNQINFMYGTKRLNQAIQNFNKEQTNLKYLMLKGDIYLQNGNLSHALEAYKRCQQKIKQLQKVNKSETFLKEKAQCSKKVSRILYKQLNLDQAISNGQQALQILQKMKGKQISCAQLLNWIGRCYYRKQTEQNQLKALNLYNESLAIYQKIQGVDSLGCADCYHNIGSLYNSQKNSKKAFEFYGKSLAIRQRETGKNSFLCAQVLTSLGGLYRKQYQKCKEQVEKKKHFDNAERILKRCFEIFKKQRGDQNIKCAKSAYKLALLYKDANMLKDAHYYASYAYNIRKKEQNLGQEHERADKIKKLIQKIEKSNDFVKEQVKQQVKEKK